MLSEGLSFMIFNKTTKEFEQFGLQNTKKCGWKIYLRARVPKVFK